MEKQTQNPSQLTAFADRHKFFVKQSKTYINWNFKHGQIRRLIFHILYYPIAYVRYMYFSYKNDAK